MKRDNVIFDIIEKEHQRQLKGIELIASENFVSDQVMQAMGSCLTNKYAEGYPGRRYYGGCEVVDQSETIAIERLKKLFNAEWANVQPHSGAQANAAVFLAVLNPGDTFLGLNLAHGGHLSHGSPVNSSGILYHATEYNVKEETGRVDYDQMEEVALREKPKLIIGGGSAYSREWDYKRMREIADKVGALLMIDMAHPAGLIAAGLLNNPLEYAHIVTSTTHKTLRGPRGGVILLGKDFENPWGKKTPKGEIKKMSQLLDSAVFPGIQGGPLEHIIAAKAVAFGEALEPEYKDYQKQVKANAAAMAQAFMDKGYKIISDGTDNHSMLIDLRKKFPELTGKVAEKALVAADITVNKNMVPFDSRSAFQTSGIRVGTPAITTRGAKEPLMGEIVEMIDTVLDGFKALVPQDWEVSYSRGANIVDLIPDPEGETFPDGQPRPKVGVSAALDQALLDEAVENARRSDLIVAVVGDVIQMIGETCSTATLELLGGQNALIDALAAVARETGKPFAVVLMSSKPMVLPASVIGTNGVVVDMAPAEGVSALLWAPSPGMKGGRAIAEIILGQTEPSGRLPITFPRHAGQLPVYYNQIRGQHGNRYADLTQDPAFAFGEGLSYTTFAYGDVVIDGADTPFAVGDTVHASVTLTNTGDRPGTEVVQAYIGDLVTSYSWTDRELKAFRRVELQPGESVTVEFDIPVADCTIVDPQARRIVEPGEFELLIGHSSRREDLKRATFTVA